MSVYYQVYINLYDKYINYKDLEKYNKYIKTIELIKHRTSNDTTYVNKENMSENYYIPKQAQFVKSFFKKSKIDSYRLSSTIMGIYNRYAIMEGVYPIQISDKSPYLITSSNDILPLGCSVLDSKEGVQIVHCP
jgi:hypothetical protein